MVLARSQGKGVLVNKRLTTRIESGGCSQEAKLAEVIGWEPGDFSPLVCVRDEDEK